MGVTMTQHDTTLSDAEATKGRDKDQLALTDLYLALTASAITQ